MNGKLNFLKSFYAIVNRFWPLKRSILRALQGIVVGFCALSVWLVIHLLTGQSLKEELLENVGIYLYMLVPTCLVLAMFGWYAGLQEERLKSQALHDDLTSLYNTRYFWERLAEELVTAKRRSSRIALILIDIDHFKRINDDYGHVFGNKVLRALGHTLKTVGRAGETIYRLGGDEFCIILPDCDWIGAHTAATRFLERIRATVIKSKDFNPIQVTASLGITVTGNGEQLDTKELLRRADRAMYDAKTKGRNRIEPIDIEIRTRRYRRSGMAN